MDQTLFNVAIAGFGALAGFLLKNIWDAVKDLQTSDKELATKVAEIELLVAGDYVKRVELDKIRLEFDKIRAEFDKSIDRLLTKLEHIESKLGK